MSYVYKQTEFCGRDGADYNLYTVGFYDPSGKWHPDSDHTDQEKAAQRVAYLNGGQQLDPVAAANHEIIRQMKRNG